MKKKLKKFSARLLLSCAALLLSLVLIECYLHRYVNLQNHGFSVPDKKQRFHPYLLFGYNPNHPDMYTVGGVTLFKPEMDREKKRFRILVLGDSYTRSYPENPAWPTYMQGLLEAAGLQSKFEIINTAVTAYTALQEKRVLELLAPVVKPDMVLATWVTNDGGGECMYVGEGYMISCPYNVRRYHFSSTPVTAPLETFLINHSRLYQLILRLQAEKPFLRDSEEVIGDLMYGIHKVNPLMREHHIEVLDSMRRLSVKEGAQFKRIFFGIVPQNYRLPGLMFAREEEIDYKSLSGYDVQEYLRKRLGLNDSLNAMKEIGRPLHPSLFWSDYGHFSEIGHRRVAAIVLRYLLPSFHLSVLEQKAVQEVLDDEDTWYRDLNTPICQGSFGPLKRLVPYTSPDVLEEPPSYRLLGSEPLTFVCSPARGIQQGMVYYLSIDGYSPGQPMEITVNQGGESILTCTVHKWCEERGKKTIPVTVSFIAVKDGKDLAVSIRPAPGCLNVLRSWVLSRSRQPTVLFRPGY